MKSKQHILAEKLHRIGIRAAKKADGTTFVWKNICDMQPAYRAGWLAIADEVIKMVKENK